MQQAPATPKAPEPRRFNLGVVNGFDPNDLSRLDPATQALVRRRQALLGPAYRLMYAHPVEIARAEGCLLWDSRGDEYLDAYNNVVPLGHCHPRVVEAVHRQMQTLCTHTRYIQEGILDFAAAILPSFGAPIEHIMFACSGSEANDLAVRIAKHHTGRQGVVITSEAYHGNSELTAGFSASLGPRSPLSPWTRRISTPDSYRMDRERDRRPARPRGRGPDRRARARGRRHRRLHRRLDLLLRRHLRPADRHPRPGRRGACTGRAAS